MYRTEQIEFLKTLEKWFFQGRYADVVQLFKETQDSLTQAGVKDLSAKFYNLVGNCYYNLNKFVEAERSFIAAINFDRRNNEYHLNFFNLLKLTHQDERFFDLLVNNRDIPSEVFIKLIQKLEHNYVEKILLKLHQNLLDVRFKSYARYNLIRVYGLTGRLDYCKVLAQNTSVVEFNDIEIFIRLLTVLNDLDLKHEMLELLQSMLEVDPGCGDVLQFAVELLDTLPDRSDLEPLVDIIKNSEAISSKIYLAEFYRKTKREKNATSLLRNVDDYRASNNLGLIYQSLGEIDLSVEQYLKTIQLNSKFAPAYRHYAHSTKSIDPRILEQTLGNFENTPSRMDKVQYGHALFHMYTKLSDYSTAANFIEIANELHAEELPFDIGWVESLYEYISSQFFSTTELVCSRFNFVPVFIIGMPRSGTTLIERWLVEYLNADTFGELGFWGHMTTNYFKSAQNIDLGEMRKNFERLISSGDKEKTIKIDKMPHNFRYLGLIARCIPEAKFIWVKRCPKAVAWSNYNSFFNVGGLAYSSKTDWIKKEFYFLEKYKSLWEGEYNAKIKFLSYEDILHNKGEVVDDLREFIGVSDHAASGDNRAYSSHTASNLLVRGGIVKNRNDDISRYQPFLKSNFEIFT